MSRSRERHVVDDAVADHDAALADVLEPGEHAQRRRLAAARRADEHHELAVLDVEVEVVDGARAVGVHLRHAIERHSGQRINLASVPRSARARPLSPAGRLPKQGSAARRTLPRWWQAYPNPTPPARSRGRPRMTLPAQRPPRIRIERIWPQIDGGRYPVKRTLGERVDVWATLVRDGHEVLGGAAALPRRPGRAAGARCRCAAIPRGPRSLARLVRGRRARALAVRRRRVGRPRGLLAARAGAQGRGRAERSRERARRRARRCSGVESLTVEEGLARQARRSLRADGRRRDPRDRRSIPSARRSAPGTSSSRARGAASPGVEKLLPEFAKLGFDVLYLPPVHPIGRDASQGPQQRADRAALRPGQPVGDRRARPAGTRRCIPTSAARRSSRA